MNTQPRTLTNATPVDHVTTLVPPVAVPVIEIVSYDDKGRAKSRLVTVAELIEEPK